MLQRLHADYMAADQHDGRVQLGGLLLGHGAHEDGMVDHGPRQRRLERELVLRRPFRPLRPGVRGVFEQAGECDGAGRDGEVERRLGGEAQEGAEFPREGGGDVLEEQGRGDERVVGRGVEVGGEEEGGAEALDVRAMGRLEGREVVPCVAEGALAAVALVVGQAVDLRSLVEPDELQLCELELEVGAACFEFGPVLPGPFDGWLKVPILEVVQDVVHVGKLFLQLLRL